MAKAKFKTPSKPKLIAKAKPKTKTRTKPRAKAAAAPKTKGKGKGKPQPLPPGAIEAVPVRLSVLGPEGPETFDDAEEIDIGPPTLFAVTPTAAVSRRYLYLIQQETRPNAGLVVLLLVFDTAEAAATRVPPVGAWQRAIVTGMVQLLASDLALTREQIAAFIGGHAPPPTPAKPPYT